MTDYIKESEDNLQRQLKNKIRVGKPYYYDRKTINKPQSFKRYYSIYICPPIDEKKMENDKGFKIISSMSGYMLTYGEFLEVQATHPPGEGVVGIMSRGKYYLQVRTRKFSAMPDLCEMEFIKRIEFLNKNKILFAVGYHDVPRNNSIFDCNSERWSRVTFAPSFEDDLDELTPEGYK